VLPDAVGRPSLGSALLDDPGAKFSAENEQQVQKEKKRAKKKETQACGNRRPRGPRAGTKLVSGGRKTLDDADIVRDGPLIVLPPGQKFDPEIDRVLVISRAGPGETPIWLNGSRSLRMAAMRAGQTYRLRIINIVPENPPINFSLKVRGDPAMWRPIAKDGADLPPGQRELCPARLTIGVGETYDFQFRPDGAGEVAIDVVRPANRFPAEITPSHKVVELRPESSIAVKIAVRE